MKKFSLILLAALAAGSLQAAGTIKPYTIRAAFAGDDAFDWNGLTNSLLGGDKGASIKPTFTGFGSLAGKARINGQMVGGSNIRGYVEGLSLLGTFSIGDHLMGTMPAEVVPLTIQFVNALGKPAPVFGAGVQIEAYTPTGGAGNYTGEIKAFDVNGNLLGITTVSGFAPPLGKSNNSAPFMGIRSNLAEIASIQIDAPGFGWVINNMDVALTASPVLNNTFFVNQVYADLLNRAPTATELTAGLAMLTANPATGLADLGYAVYTSQEFSFNARYLAKCYLAAMGRNPDFAGFSQIFPLMQAGAQQATTLTSFLSTPEFQAAYPSTMSNTTVVTKLYNTLLGRAPEPAGLAYWSLLLNLGLPRAFVLNGFMVSPEYDADVAHQIDAVLPYFVFLKRDGDPAGLNFWKVVLDAGVPLKSVVGSFIGSPEYFARF